jgi:hypothetical protein
MLGVLDNWNNGQQPISGANQSIQPVVLNPAEFGGY